MKKDLTAIYGSLFRNSALDPSETAFLRTAFLQFTSDWRRRGSDPKSIGESNVGHTEGYISQTQAASILQVSQRTIALLVECGVVEARRFKLGRARRVSVNGTHLRYMSAASTTVKWQRSTSFLAESQVHRTAFEQAVRRQMAVR